MAGTNAIVGSCKPTASYQVWGACSDLKKKRKKNEQFNGYDPKSKEHSSAEIHDTGTRK